jgi:hypothetical protein
MPFCGKQQNPLLNKASVGSPNAGETLVLTTDCGGLWQVLFADMP